MTAMPKYKHIGMSPRQSPIELKEKMRKSYKNKIQNCRGMLMDRLRGTATETDLHETLADIYKSMFNNPQENINVEEIELMDEIRKELVQEELDWWIKEYEQSQMINVDWSAIEESSDVICLVCQKTNFILNNGILSCTHCNITVPTQSSLVDIKNSISNVLDSHNCTCNSNAQFGLVTEENETHIYLLCESCMDMKLVI